MAPSTHLEPSRRTFLGVALGTAATAFAGAIGHEVSAADAPASAAAVPGKIKKSLKFGMVDVPGTLLDKFKSA